MIAVGGKTDRTIRCRPADAGFVCQVGDGERVIYALGAAIEQPCHRRPQRRLALCAERAHAPPSKGEQSAGTAFIVAAAASRCNGNNA